MTTATTSPDAVSRAQTFPRLRYMGSKYRLLPHLERVFTEIGGGTAVDAFSGSGVGMFKLASLDTFRSDLLSAARLRGLVTGDT
jgi:D12 class N6 adenine-specific DNA methyltransferase